jgi:tetratricopeptide (TPR) repeat protein
MEQKVMATVKAATPSPPALVAGASPRPGRPLWQAPVFVLGVGAFLAVWLSRPLFPDNQARRLDRQLNSARQLLERADGDLDEAQRLTERARKLAAHLEDREGEAALLLGTVHIRLAERAPTAEAAEHWNLARTVLLEAEQLGVPEDDTAKLSYRLAKVAFHTGEDLGEVVRRLEDSADGADNLAEAYRLLTQAYLRIPKPDLARALEANRKLRDVAEISDADAAQAKLLGGELLLRMGKAREARESLEKIGARAAPGVQARARLLRARSYQEEEKWGDAARLYETALADTRVSVEEPARAHYNLGLCYRRLEQPHEAKRAWMDCVRLARGEEGPAAAVALAQMQLQDASPDKALESLTVALAQVRRPADWKNTLLDLARARQVFEKAVDVYRRANQFDLALKVTEVYDRLAVPPRSLVLRGEVAAEWAQSRLDRATEERDREEARQLYKQAAAAYAEAARRASGKTGEFGECLWLSASHALAGQDYAHGIEQLERYLKTEPPPARQGEGWYRMAEAYRGSGNPQAADKAFRRCLDYSNDAPRFAYHARYQLAMSALEAGDRDEAEAALVLNLKLLRYDADTEAPEKTLSAREAQEKSLFALGGLYYQRRNYRRVVRRLEEAIRLFKDNPEVTLARFQLADSYRQIAAQENQSFLLGEKMTAEAREHFQQEHRRWLTKAAEEFAALDELLARGTGKDGLTKKQRSQVPFITAKCWFNLSCFDKALAIYERLIERSAGPASVAGLDALGGAVSCHAALGQLDLVRQRLLQIEKMVPKMDEAVRKPWEAWLEEARAGLPAP